MFVAKTKLLEKSARLTVVVQEHSKTKRDVFSNWVKTSVK